MLESRMETACSLISPRGICIYLPSALSPLTLICGLCISRSNFLGLALNSYMHAIIRTVGCRISV